ncbi:hypothetical protein [Streptomyces sp. NPDC057910]
MWAKPGHHLVRGAVTTKTGLTAEAGLDLGDYPKGHCHVVAGGLG